MSTLYRFKLGKGEYGLNKTQTSSEDLLLIRESIKKENTQITIGGINYTYIKSGTTGTKEAPEQFDKAIGGVETTVDEDDNPIKIYRELLFNSGVPSDKNSWFPLIEKTFNIN